MVQDVCLLVVALLVVHVAHAQHLAARAEVPETIQIKLHLNQVETTVETIVTDWQDILSIAAHDSDTHTLAIIATMSHLIHPGLCLCLVYLLMGVFLLTLRSFATADRRRSLSPGSREDREAVASHMFHSTPLHAVRPSQSTTVRVCPFVYVIRITYMYVVR